MAKLPTLGLLSITDGRLMADIGQVYEAVSYFIARPAFTHELPRYGRLAKPMVRAQFDGLAGDESQPWEVVRDKALAQYGSFIDVPDEWNGSLADDSGPIDTLLDAIATAR